MTSDTLPGILCYESIPKRLFLAFTLTTIDWIYRMMPDAVRR